MLRKPAVPLRVAGTVSVLAAVNLDYETLIPADKIDDVRSDRLLANELVIVDGASA